AERGGVSGDGGAWHGRGRLAGRGDCGDERVGGNRERGRRARDRGDCDYRAAECGQVHVAEPAGGGRAVDCIAGAGDDDGHGGHGSFARGAVVSICGYGGDSSQGENEFGGGENERGDGAGGGGARGRGAAGGR